MKNIIDIYEGVLGNIDDQIESMDIYVQLDKLYKNLCSNNSLSKWKEGISWLKNYLDSKPELTVKKSDLYVWQSHIYPKDTNKDYIEFIPYGNAGFLSIKFIVNGMAFWLTSDFPIDHYIPQSSYKFAEVDLHFHGSKGDNIYIVPDELKPFIDKCIDTILRKTVVKIKIKR